MSGFASRYAGRGPSGVIRDPDLEGVGPNLPAACVRRIMPGVRVTP